jgi:hypothetical protein
VTIQPSRLWVVPRICCKRRLLDRVHALPGRCRLQAAAADSVSCAPARYASLGVRSIVPKGLCAYVRNPRVPLHMEALRAERRPGAGRYPMPVALALEKTPPRESRADRAQDLSCTGILDIGRDSGCSCIDPEIRARRWGVGNPKVGVPRGGARKQHRCRRDRLLRCERFRC